MILKKSLQENMAILDGILPVGKSQDLLVRNFNLGGRCARVYYLDGFLNDVVMERMVSRMFAGVCGMQGKRRKSNTVDAGKIVYVAVRYAFVFLLLWLCVVSMIGTTSTPSIYADF